MANRMVTTDRPAPVALSHIVLRTAHLDETIAFYDRLIGMKANYRSEGGAALSYDGEHHRMALMAVAPGEEQNRMAPGLEHVAFKIRSLGDLLGNYRRLKDLGVDPFMCVHHGGTVSAYYIDPDGVQVETFIDTQIADLSIEGMASEGFAANPVGVPIDLDDLVTRFEAGEPVSELLKQPELQEGQLEELIGRIMAVRAPSAG
jgi:catechol-2,3-dioxygenase